MILLTPDGQAVHSRHVIRLFVKSDREATEPSETPETPTCCQVMAELVTGRSLTVADTLPLAHAQAILKELTHYWIQGRDYADIASLLKRLQKGASSAQEESGKTQEVSP